MSYGPNSLKKFVKQMQDKIILVTVVNTWNKLPSSIVNAPSLNFKAMLDILWN